MGSRACDLSQTTDTHQHPLLRIHPVDPKDLYARVVVKASGKILFR
jgi:hypothetical protein